MDDRLSGIARCGECCEKWSKDVTCPLSTFEMPDPPKVVDLLFVGVAPTTQEGQHTFILCSPTFYIVDQ